jgi:hypothetical protein
VLHSRAGPDVVPDTIRGSNTGCTPTTTPPVACDRRDRRGSRPHFLPRRGVPHRPSELLLFEAQVVDHLETLDDAPPRQGCRRHRSQWRSTMEIDHDVSEVELRRQRDAFVEGVRTPLQESDPATAGLAESFKRITEL